VQCVPGKTVTTDSITDTYTITRHSTIGLSVKDILFMTEH